MALVKLTAEDFVAQLASDSPTPGGGSASALAGAMAAALVEMCCNLTVGREKFRDSEEQMQTILARGRDLREKLIEAVDEDTTAYDAVSEAYKLPRSTEEEKAARTAAIQDALKGASDVPLRVAIACMEIAQLARITQDKANPNVASDARVARVLAEAAREGATANVEINLASITDAKYVEKMKGELEGLQG